MLDSDLRTVRAAIGRHQNQRRRRNVRFPQTVRREVLAYARQRRSAGITVHRIATDLGVAMNTLQRWLKLDGDRKFHPVSVQGARAVVETKAALVLRGPRGITVEGLDPAAVAAILLALG